MTYAEIRIESIERSPLNPRTEPTEESLQELVEDIRRRGVLQPVVVRPTAEGFELVCGERRTVAAGLAGLTEVPAMVQDLSDTQVIETALVENCLREDLHPLEVAAAYRELVARGLSIEDLMERLGKGRSAVYATLKLTELAPAVQELFRKGRLTASNAGLVARIPDPKVQEKAANAISEGDYERGQMSFRDASELIQRDFMRDLKDAAFDRGEEGLFEGVPSCRACPKRTGNQPELYKDVSRPDVCTDPKCFDLKAEADWKRTEARAKEPGGPKVLSRSETKRLIVQGHISTGAPYVPLDATCDGDPKYRTYQQLLGKHAKEHVVLARDESGRVHELLPQEKLRDALQDAGHNFKPGRGRADPDDVARKRSRRRKFSAEVARRTIAALVTKAEGALALERLLRVVASVLGDVAGDDVAERRGWEGGWDAKRLQKLGLDGLRGLVLELALLVVASDLVDYDSKVGAPIRAAAEALGVDVEEIGAALKKEQATAEKVKPKKRARAEVAA